VTLHIGVLAGHLHLAVTARHHVTIFDVFSGNWQAAQTKNSSSQFW